MATVLDELARVKCRGLEGLHKIKIQSPACSHYLHTKSKHHNLLRNFWEPERAPATLSKVNSKADLSFIYNREFYEKEAKIGKDDPRYECHKHGIYIDLEKAELFSGLFPELYQKEYKAGSIDFDGINIQSKHRAISFQVDDAAEPIEESEQFEKLHVDLNEIIEIAKQNFTKEDLMEYKAGSIDFDGINTQSKHRAVSFQVDDAAEPIEESEQFEKPHADLNEIIEIAKQNFTKEDLIPPIVDLNEIIEIAKQNFTKEDLMGLHTVCNNLDDLPYEEESQLKQSISNETVTSEIDKLLKEKESEMMPFDHTDHHNFKWLSINEEEEKSPTEPEDITYGWIISPKSYASYIEGNSDQVSTMDIDNVENEFEDVSEVAKFLVENVLTEAQIIVSSWEKGLGMEATKAKQIQDATESVDVSAGENTSQLSLLTSHEKDKSDMKMETLCEWEPDRMKIGGSNSHRRRSNPDIFYEFCPLPIYYKVTRSESILGTAIEATEDMYRYVPLSRSLNELFTDSF